MGPCRNIAIPFGVGKTRMVGLNDGEKNLKICNHLDTISAFDRRMDRETDRQSSCDSIVRAMHTRRAVIISSAIYQEYLARP